MAKTNRKLKDAAAPVTPERARRLYRLLQLLGRKPQPRQVLTKTLKLGVRGFYRDLEALRQAGIETDLLDGRYVLIGKLADAVNRLPFPDLGLTLGEAQQLARGKSEGHRKVKRLMDEVTKGPKNASAKRR